jgi:hypothetical protein
MAQIIGGVGGTIDGGRELSIVEQKQPFLGSLLRRIIGGINTTATNAAVSPTGETAAPPPINSVNVSTFGEMVHVAIQHNGTLQRNIQYATQVDVNGGGKFAQPLVIDHGSSRTSHPISLPTFASDGTTKNVYAFRSVAQYPSSQPTPPVTVGGASSPTLFTLSGTTAGDLLPSGGSGTSRSDGQAPGFLGKTQTRQQ